MALGDEALHGGSGLVGGVARSSRHLQAAATPATASSTSGTTEEHVPTFWDRRVDQGARLTPRAALADGRVRNLRTLANLLIHPRQ